MKKEIKRIKKKKKIDKFEEKATSSLKNNNFSVYPGNHMADLYIKQERIGKGSFGEVFRG